MENELFEELVLKALSELPEEFQNKLENIDIVITDLPTPEQMHKLGLLHHNSLLGLYEGVPLPKRGWHYGMTLPDKITIFQKPIESKCHSDRDIASEIKKVVRHEIAHHFGIDDESLRKIESQNR